jgi:hypothetical protein
MKLKGSWLPKCGSCRTPPDLPDNRAGVNNALLFQSPVPRCTAGFLLARGRNFAFIRICTDTKINAVVEVERLSIKESHVR